ncbi:MAG TPA: SDR family oxidoreductase, partial [Dongiaceae bacterium]|nr:SDR family oxidoreductase [Dongiaceae bacterium]
GLSDPEFNSLAQKVNLVINSAASVNFREPLDQALLTNTLSLHTLIKLVKVKQIPMVHVSTCYVNGFNTGLIAESISAPKLNGVKHNAQGYFEVGPVIERLQHQIATAQAHNQDKKARELALTELGIEESNRFGWNDTYTFTKWLGEQVLVEQLQGQNLTILRPSIVESTLQEPVPGWIEGVKVADAIILAYAREKVTFFPGNKQGIIDIIPADLVANSIILSGAEALIVPPAHRIYQCSSSQCNPIQLKDVIHHVQSEAMSNFAQYKNLFYRQPKRPFIMVPNAMFKAFMGIAYRLLVIRSAILTRMGVGMSTAQLANLETALKLAVIFSFYTQPRYRFSNTKLRALSERMGAADQERFPVDGQLIEWSQYLRKIHLAGLDQFSLAPKKAKPKQKQARKQTEAA